MDGQGDPKGVGRMSIGMKIRLFLASGLWGVSIVFSVLEDTFMALGDKIVGMTREPKRHEKI